MSESVYLIREQGSGEPRVSRSPLIEQCKRSSLIEQWSPASRFVPFIVPLTRL